MEQQNLYPMVVRNVREYGSATVEDRAIPDYRDGLKPVQRRIVWGMSRLGLSPSSGYMKAARTVGDVMGKYHPHGDGAIYQAMVNMANGSSPIVDGEGNWGGPTDSAAAMRYTEAKLTEYGQNCLVDPDYLKVADYLPTYDGSFEEPLILPARLPNLLLNGASGIAVAVATQIPAFEKRGVLKLVLYALKGHTITAKHCREHLVFTGPYGGLGELVSDAKTVQRFFAEGSESLTFRPTRKLDYKAGTYTIKSQTPRLALNKIHETFSKLDEVASVADMSSAEERIKMVITLKPSFRDQAQEIFAKYDKRLSRKLPFSINVTERRLGDQPDEHQVRFRSSTVPELINKWTSWRIKLEVKVLEYKRGQLIEQIERLDLILVAIDKLDALIKTIRKKYENRAALTAATAKVLGIEKPQAEIVLGMSLSTLSNLSEAETLNKREKLNRNLRKIKKDLKQPEVRVAKQLKEE